MVWEYFIGKGLNGFKNIFIREIKENTPITDDLEDCSKYLFLEIANYKKRQRINELKKENEFLNMTRETLDNNFLHLDVIGFKINNNNLEIAQLEREIAEDRYEENKMEIVLKDLLKLADSFEKDKQLNKKEFADGIRYAVFVMDIKIKSDKEIK